jgi:nitronate monooxygenase/enoyl-[acyl-carrier protein] reductase II
MNALRDGRTHELVAFTGQSAGLIGDVPPAAKIVKDMVAGAERALELG